MMYCASKVFIFLLKSLNLIESINVCIKTVTLAALAPNFRVFFRCLALGLVQLEALEMLSSMSEGKVRGLLDILPREAAEALKADLTRIKMTFEETSPDNDDGKVDTFDCVTVGI